MEQFKKWFATALRIAYIRQGSAGHLCTYRKIDEVDIHFAAKGDKHLASLMRTAMNAEKAMDDYIIARSK